MADVVEISGLRKRYGSTQVLDGLNLAVAPGEVHGFLGPNGAGKSTTIRTLLGLVRADSGSVRLLGGDPWADAVALHRRLAYVPGDVTLWPTLTGGEVIDLLGRLRGGIDRRRADELIERFDLDPRRRTRTYSTGNRQKVALVSALSARAELLILDEPTSGLDPLMEATFRTCLAQERDRGATVLLSSHVLSEVEAACDRVTIIRKGVTVESGTLDELRHLARSTVTARLDHLPPALGRLPEVHDLAVDGSTVSFRTTAAGMDGAMRALLDGGLQSLTVRPPALEDVFLRYYRTGLVAGEPAG